MVAVVLTVIFSGIAYGLLFSVAQDNYRVVNQLPNEIYYFFGTSFYKPADVSMEMIGMGGGCSFVLSCRQFYLRSLILGLGGSSHEEEVRNAPTAMKAAQMGRERHRPLRPDWEAVKEEVMLEALRTKFTQHKSLRSLLLDTGDAELVEHTANDAYWGDGGDGSGKNRLGALLMQVRAELRASSIE